MQTMVDGLPAIGIIAAVLGVIHTMGSVTEPPEVFRRDDQKRVGRDVLGRVSGLRSGWPNGLARQTSLREEHQFYLIIRNVLMAHLSGNAPQVSGEIGRGSVPSKVQPTFFELEETLNATAE